MTKLIRGATGVLFSEDQKKVLVVVEDETNLSYGKKAGMVSIPMGSIEPGESPEKTVVREMLEETGYRIKISHSLGLFRLTEFKAEVQVSTFIVESVNGFEKEAEGKLESKWIDPEELMIHTFVRPPTKEAVRNAVYFLRHKERASC